MVVPTSIKIKAVVNAYTAVCYLKEENMNTNSKSDSNMMIANLTCDVFFANKNTFEKEHQGEGDLAYILKQYESYGVGEDELFCFATMGTLFEEIKKKVLVSSKGHSVRIEDLYFKIFNLVVEPNFKSPRKHDFLMILDQLGDGKMLGCLISILIRFGYKLSIVRNHLFTTVVVDDVALC